RDPIPRPDHARLDCQAQFASGALGLGGEIAYHVTHDVAQAHDVPVDVEIARRQALDVQQRRRTADEGACLAFERRKTRLDPGWRILLALCLVDHVARADDDGSHRVTQLVGHYRDELVARGDGGAEVPDRLQGRA